MFDSPELARSRFYFQMLQVVRIVRDAIEDQRLRWEEWKDDWPLLMRSPYHARTASPTEREALLASWHQAHSSCLKIMTTILNMVEKKQNEIESLRNGVSRSIARLR